MKIKQYLPKFLALVIASGSSLVSASPLEDFNETRGWSTTSAASAVGDHLQVAPSRAKDAVEGENIIHNGDSWKGSEMLVSNRNLPDSVTRFDYLLPGDATAIIYVQGRYAVELKNTKNNEWQQIAIRHRAPRYDGAGYKIADSLLLEVQVDGDTTVKNRIYPTLSEGAPAQWESPEGASAIKSNEGPIAIRNFVAEPADFSAISMPAESGQSTNEDELIDYVAIGKDAFESVGCNVCHATQADSAAAGTGPNLFGLFQKTPRDREVVEGGENHRFTIKANSNYLHNSVRTPSAQLAVIESGKNQGEPWPPNMPPISKQILSDMQVDAIGAYLATLNESGDQGPVVKLMEPGEQEAYDPVTDGLQFLVSDRTRIQRGPMEGLSGRAIHVGQPNGVNYSFDPRILAIAKIWQGGYLDMSGELLNRGGKGLKAGYESRELDFRGQGPLFAPLHASGELVDFSFKSAKFGDPETAKASLYMKQDHLDRLAEENAQFLGYQINSKQKDAAPTFRYRIGDNQLAVQTLINANGDTQIEVQGTLKAEQAFALNPAVLQDVKVSKGQINNGQWQIPAGTKKATLSARMALVDNPWQAPDAKFDHRRQPLRTEAAEADMPAGYSIENYYPPKDNYGRDQLFEALGLALAEDGTLVVATRTAGIWRLVEGEWRQFAEGTFDSLGLEIEDKKGLQLVVGQKAELTRISDTNSDGVADNYETLFDAHSYHGNYHSYMHGPVRGSDGAYYIAINLADGHDGSTYKAGGAYMGATGGFSGWSLRVEPDGSFEPWSSGLRSPAGIALGPDKRIWYTENQGEYVGTSKLFVMEKGAFYGHPSGLVDLPGMTPDSPEIAWDNVADERERAVVLLPHNRVANSPGNPAWDTTDGRFGPFAGQMLVGDQTQSNLLRIATQSVDGREQGSVMPFISGLESGVMRPVFLKDGSLLLGQTGRGWQAKGGHVASLQHVRWDGKTIPAAIHRVETSKAGLVVHLTQPLRVSVGAAQLQDLIEVESWVYRDAPDYGSDELDTTAERVLDATVSKDRKQVHIQLEQREREVVHPQQTARVYHVVLQNEKAFAADAPKQLEAYMTVYGFGERQ